MFGIILKKRSSEKISGRKSQVFWVNVTQSVKRYQVLGVELKLPLYTQMITEHIKKNSSWYLVIFRRYQNLYDIRIDRFEK